MPRPIGSPPPPSGKRAATIAAPPTSARHLSGFVYMNPRSSGRAMSGFANIDGGEGKTTASRISTGSAGGPPRARRAGGGERGGGGRAHADGHRPGPARRRARREPAGQDGETDHDQQHADDVR